MVKAVIFSGCRARVNYGGVSGFKNDKTVRLFIEEAQEIVEGSEQLFMELEGGDYDPDTINEIGRKLHTLKGSGALIGFTQMSHIAHVVEDIFEKVKSGNDRLNEEEFAFIFAAMDKVKRLIEAVVETGDEEDTGPPLPPLPGGGGGAPAEHAVFEAEPEPAPVVAAPAPVSTVSAEGFERARFGTPAFRMFYEEFFEEAENLLVSVEQVLMMFGIQVDASRLVSETQRALDTLRQYAVMLGQSDLAEICHELVSVLKLTSSGVVKLTEELVDALFPLVTSAKVVLEAMDRQEQSGQDYQSQIKALMRFLPEVVQKSRMQSPDAAGEVFGHLSTRFSGAELLTPYERRRVLEEQINGCQIVEAFLDLGPDCIRRGFHPREFAVNVEQGGQVLACLPIVKQGETGRERFWMLVAAADDPQRVIEQFQFIADLGPITTNVLTLSSGDTEKKYEAHRKKVEAMPPPAAAAAPPEAKPAAGAAPPPAAKAATGKAAEAEAKGGKSRSASTIRVETSRLDHVMNLVGELVIGRIRLEGAVRQLDLFGLDQAKLLKDYEKLTRDFDELMAEDPESLAQGRHRRLKDMVRELQDQGYEGVPIQPEDLSRVSDHLHRLKDELDMVVERKRALKGVLGQLLTSVNGYQQVFNRQTRLVDELKETNAQLNRYSADLQEQVMKVRMLPIKQVFDKFPRMVRDLSKKLGKEVDWETEGEDTELDKTLIEKIEDPLMHLVRNAVDHGMETIEERETAGKAVQGTLTVSAHQEGNNIVIKVQDDGRGVDTQKILAKAIEKRLVEPAEAEKMGKKEIYMLLFRAGFSTAAQVTEISGRGVGMDVVKENIQNLKGTIEVQSEVGKGTSFIMRLPLTLAIIQALLVTASGRTFVIPLSNVKENLSADDRLIETVEGARVLRLREEVLSIVRLSDVFHYPPAQQLDQPPLVILEHGTDRVALQVDRLLGKQEVVVKSLGSLLRNVRNISGATILDQGKAALILDVPAVMETVKKLKNLPLDENALTVVVADDSLSTRRHHKMMLERARYTVLEASSGREALELLLQNNTQVLVTDVNMPLMDGFELTRRVRLDPRLRHLRVVVITALDDEDTRQRAQQVGVDFLLNKPVPESDLLRKVAGEGGILRGA